MSKIELFKTDVSNINAFSVQLKQSSPRITEVRFSTHGCPYYDSIMFSGLVLQNREEVYTIHNVEEMLKHFTQIAHLNRVSLLLLKSYVSIVRP